MKPLLWKEWRAQRPLFWLMLLVSAFFFGYPLFTEFPDSLSQASIYNDPEVGDGAFMVFVAFVLCFAVATSVLVRERDEGTLEFLDALPVGRTRIFLAKCVVALGIVWVQPLLATGLSFVFHSLSRDSLEPRVHLVVEAQILATDLLIFGAFLGVGLLFSYLRRYAFLVLGIGFALLLYLQQLDLPWVARINPLDLWDYRFEEGRMVVPWTRLSATLAAGAAGFVGAWILFCLQGDRSERFFQSLRERRWVAAIGMAATVATVLVWVVAGVVVSWDSYEAEEAAPRIGDARVVYPDWKTAEIRTEAYHFVFPSNLRTRARSLADGADNVEETVRRFFAADQGAPIVADLGSLSSHAAGTAYWDKIRMNIAGDDDTAFHIAVLGHETAHVFIERLSEGRIGDHFNATRWFHEGVASYVEHEFFQPVEERAKLHRQAAAAHHLDQSDFDELADNAAFSREFDTNLVYALGLVFAEALAESSGPEAAARLARAFADTEKRDLSGTGSTLWGRIFQRAGLSLTSALDAYHRRLDQLVEEHRGFVDSLPGFEARVHEDSGLIAIEPVGGESLPDDLRLTCRFRPAEDSAATDYFGPALADDNQFWITAAQAVDGAVWFQVGIESELTSLPIYGRWTRVRVGR